MKLFTCCINARVNQTYIIEWLQIHPEYGLIPFHAYLTYPKVIIKCYANKFIKKESLFRLLSMEIWVHINAHLFGMALCNWYLSHYLLEWSPTNIPFLPFLLHNFSNGKSPTILYAKLSRSYPSAIYLLLLSMTRLK